MHSSSSLICMQRHLLTISWYLNGMPETKGALERQKPGSARALKFLLTINPYIPANITTTSRNGLYPSTSTPIKQHNALLVALNPTKKLVHERINNVLHFTISANLHGFPTRHFSKKIKKSTPRWHTVHGSKAYTSHAPLPTEDHMLQPHANPNHTLNPGAAHRRSDRMTDSERLD